MRNISGLLPSQEQQRRLTYFMEIGLIGMLFVGIERGNGGIVLNTAVALAVTQLPPLLERDYEIPMDRDSRSGSPLRSSSTLSGPSDSRVLPKRSTVKSGGGTT